MDTLFCGACSHEYDTIMDDCYQKIDAMYYLVASIFLIAVIYDRIVFMTARITKELACPSKNIHTFILFYFCW